MTPELLRAGRWTIVPGMRVTDGSHTYIVSDRRDDAMWDGEIPPVFVPDPTDPLTRAAMLADLARRVGLDPEWGATWRPFAGPDGRIVAWEIRTEARDAVTFWLPCSVGHPPPAGNNGEVGWFLAENTTDPLRALLLAGAATAP